MSVQFDHRKAARRGNGQTRMDHFDGEGRCLWASTNTRNRRSQQLLIHHYRDIPVRAGKTSELNQHFGAATERPPASGGENAKRLASEFHNAVLVVVSRWCMAAHAQHSMLIISRQHTLLAEFLQQRFDLTVLELGGLLLTLVSPANEGGQQNVAGQVRAGQGRAGQGRAGQGRYGQGRYGQGWSTDSIGSSVVRRKSDQHPCRVT
jgi:hypothetical protein